MCTFSQFPSRCVAFAFRWDFLWVFGICEQAAKKEEWAGQNKKQELSDFGWCLHIDLPPILLVRGRRALFPLLFLAHPVSTRSSSLCSGLPRGRQHKHVCFARLRTTVSLFLLFFLFSLLYQKQPCTTNDGHPSPAPRRASSELLSRPSRRGHLGRWAGSWLYRRYPRAIAGSTTARLYV